MNQLIYTTLIVAVSATGILKQNNDSTIYYSTMQPGKTITEARIADSIERCRIDPLNCLSDMSFYHAKMVVLNERKHPTVKPVKVKVQSDLITSKTRAPRPRPAFVKK